MPEVQKDHDYGDIAFDEIKTSKILDCSRALLRKQRREKTGVPFFRIGYSIRYMRSDIDKFIADSKALNSNQ